MVNEISGWWFGTCFFPFHKWDVILPIDEVIFFKMVKTTNQMFLHDYLKLATEESLESTIVLMISPIYGKHIV